jgi:hypothetical protein
MSARRMAPTRTELSSTELINAVICYNTANKCIHIFIYLFISIIICPVCNISEKWSTNIGVTPSSVWSQFFFLY